MTNVLISQSLFTLLLPLYLLPFLGWIGAKTFSIEKEQIASLLIYLFTPLVMGSSIAKMHFHSSLLSLPFLVFFCATLVSLLTWYTVKSFFPPHETNLIAACAGMANSGYFGIPVAMALLPSEHVGAYILAIQGFLLHENLIALYLLFRTNTSPLKSILRLLKMPSLSAVAIGLLISGGQRELPESILKFFDLIRSTYIVLGMMLLGVALAEVKRVQFDLKFIGVSLGIRFLFWPLALICMMGATYLLGLPDYILKVILIIGLLPVAANTIAYASLLNLSPEKMVVTVALSTLIAMPLILIFVPFVY